MKYAKPRLRLGAFLVDLFVTVAAFIGIHYVVNNFEFIEEFKLFINQDFTLDGFFLFIDKISTTKSFYFFVLALLFYLIYFVFIPLMFKGKTLGRAIFRIRVTKLNDAKPQFAHLFVREIIVHFLFSLFSLGSIFIINLFLLIFSRGHRTIADRMSNTVVMKDEYYLSYRRK